MTRAGLLSAIPGLALHRSDPVPVQSFDAAAVVAMRETVVEIANMYPVGAVAWISSERPDVRRYLRSCETAVDQAVFAEDMAALTGALARYANAHQRAFQLFLERPAVMEG